MSSKPQEQQKSKNDSETNMMTMGNDGMGMGLVTGPSRGLPPGVGEGLLLPPQNRRVSDQMRNQTQPRSNLSVLLESQASTNASNVAQQQPRPSTYPVTTTNMQRQHSFEADSASGPIPQPRSTDADLARSAPTRPAMQFGVRSLPPPARIPSSAFSRSNSVEEIEVAIMGLPSQNLDANNDTVRRCISSKELGTLAPPSGSPYASMLHQREVLQATLQQRLMDARQSSIDRPLTPSSDLPESSDCSASADSSMRRTQTQLKNETRNRRRAAHTRAVTNELCEIVTDLFIAEAKLLNASSYGLDTSLRQDQILKNIMNFVSALPPRYALGVDTPSEVLLHMRLMAAARTDNSRAVVHLTSLKGSQWAIDGNDQSRQLVTIACVDAHGLLEYITRLLATGGSRVLDADVMLSSTDNIALDRFVVQMKGRLRLDKLSQSIEAFLAEAQERAAQDEQEAASSKCSSCKSSPKTPSMTRQASGPLYFQAPKIAHQESSPSQLQHEIEAAVPLSDMLLASASSHALTNLVPMRGSSITGLRRGNSFPAALLMQPMLTPSDGNSTRSGQSTVQTQPAAEQQQPIPDTVERPRRTLVNREATSFGEPCEEEDHLHNPPIDYLTVASRGYESSESNLEDRIIPLIPFEELMLIETLGMGRVSTIYRAAWQQRRAENEVSALTAVEMVALKVATVNQDTCDTLHVDELRREADIAAMLKHPNICDLIGVAADAECFCLAYEYCEGGSLLGLLSETSRYYEYLPIALDIANGMAYLHSRQVIHRDLKPSNVLLTRDHRAKIADFGMSVANRGQELTAETGTYRYMAPEVIRHESYSSNADVYSFGILLWQLITREVPFATMTPIQAAFSVAEGRRPEIPVSTPPQLREIIQACWDQDSHQRPSFTYIAMALADYARMAFSPANVGAQTLQIANEMLATVRGNSTINVDFSTAVLLRENSWKNSNNSNGYNNSMSGSSDHNVGLEIE
eukprot:CAMPEP_0119017948 /NCGR_PEP_ID=MMETSP1176-20130426/18167_1 /TAXON_ID=265551 /ORGANISM="Synedropsis recta cf, Strain CCMP1620" /LENGTH=975 /DNA_ID=CAMNT_0006971823 /DNA_START=314 /DNA_END=3241 /DNA_ORIENTATION=+